MSNTCPRVDTETSVLFKRTELSLSELQRTFDDLCKESCPAGTMEGQFNVLDGAGDCRTEGQQSCKREKFFEIHTIH